MRRKYRPRSVKSDSGRATCPRRSRSGEASRISLREHFLALIGTAQGTDIEKPEIVKFHLPGTTKPEFQNVHFPHLVGDEQFMGAHANEAGFVYQGPFRFDAPNEQDLAVGTRPSKIEASAVAGIQAQIVGPLQDAEEELFSEDQRGGSTAMGKRKMESSSSSFSTFGTSDETLSSISSSSQEKPPRPPMPGQS